MGWYVTCQICGQEGKYGLTCDCYRVEAKRHFARLKGCVIEDSFTRGDGCCQFLIQKLKSDTHEIFFLRICVEDAGAEYSCWRKVLELTEEQYLKYRDQRDE